MMDSNELHFLGQFFINKKLSFKPKTTTINKKLASISIYSLMMILKQQKQFVPLSKNITPVADLELYTLSTSDYRHRVLPHVGIRPKIFYLNLLTKYELYIHGTFFSCYLTWHNIFCFHFFFKDLKFS